MISELVSKYIRNLRRENQLAERTITSYRSDLKAFSKHFESKKGVYEITERDIERYSELLQNSERLNDKSIIRKISAIRGFFNYLLDENQLIRSPLKRFKLTKSCPDKIPLIMNKNEISAFFATFQAEFIALRKTVKKRQGRGDSTLQSEYKLLCSMRNKLIFKLIYETGVRPGELLSMKTGQIKIRRDDAVLLTDRTERTVMNITNPDTIKCLREYNKYVINLSIDTKTFFFNKSFNQLSTIIIQRIFKSYLAKAGIRKDMTPSTLRHTYAVNLIQKNTDIETLRLKLGYDTYEGLLIYKNFFLKYKK
jgi:site-specific recombinase XerD